MTRPQLAAPTTTGPPTQFASAIHMPTAATAIPGGLTSAATPATVLQLAANRTGITGLTTTYANARPIFPIATSHVVRKSSLETHS